MKHGRESERLTYHRRIRSVFHSAPDTNFIWASPLHLKSYKEVVKGCAKLSLYISEITVTEKPTPMTQRKKKRHLG